MNRPSNFQRRAWGWGLLLMRGLFRTFCGPGQQTRHRLPEGQRVYAVGDVHGRADLLRRLHKAIVRDAGRSPDRDNTVVYLGDYLDRGHMVRETLEEAAGGLPDSFDSIFLRGNHEQMFLDFLDDPALLETWLGLGGQATLLNYGVRPPAQGFCTGRAEEVRDNILQAMPDEHLRFLGLLRPVERIGDYVFVHAGIRPGVALDRQSEGDLFWIRDEFLASQRDHGLRVVHGHTIQDRPTARANRISVDTGAYATGVLSCAVLEDDQVRFLSTTDHGRRGNA